MRSEAEPWIIMLSADTASGRDRITRTPKQMAAFGTSLPNGRSCSADRLESGKHSRVP
jgi:hypothetical protein